ncbi:MAG: SGNH/GDSL hydrolase family protein [Acidobacteriota bacterium]
MRTGLMLLAIFAVASCGGKTPTQPPPPPEGPYIVCPADFQIESFEGNPIPVGYALPGASGGTPPLNVVCTPPSGTSMAVGEHPITCTVTDGASKTASCTFKATVTTPPRLTLTQFMAFGDRLTYGISSDAITTLGQRLTFQRAFLEPPPSTAYPNQLEQMLRTRYKLQSSSVYNEGVPGEQVDPGGLARMPSAIRAHPTEVLLLMEGTNDLSALGGSDRAIDGLGRMVRDARGRGVDVLLATVPPARAGGSYIPSRDVTARRIPPFNDQIRALAASENVPLVDVYDAMKDKLYLIGNDDLHPTPQGYVVMAQTFFDAIRKQYEIKPPSQ